MRGHRSPPRRDVNISPTRSRTRRSRPASHALRGAEPSRLGFTSRGACCTASGGAWRDSLRTCTALEPTLLLHQQIIRNRRLGSAAPANLAQKLLPLSARPCAGCHLVRGPYRSRCRRRSPRCRYATEFGSRQAALPRARSHSSMQDMAKTSASSVNRDRLCQRLRCNASPRSTPEARPPQLPKLPSGPPNVSSPVSSDFCCVGLQACDAGTRPHRDIEVGNASPTHVRFPLC